MLASTIEKFSVDTIPKVSVIVPAYNVRSYIGEALRSLEQQTFQNFEVLIVDDGSTDDTAEIVKPFCQRDPRFQLLQKSNGGLSSARNYGLHHARAEYIALLDGDDAYKPDKLATHVAVLERMPKVGVVYSASQIIRDDGRPTLIQLDGKPINADPVLALLCKNFIGHGSNAVFRHALLEEVGEFDEALRSSEDVDLWLRIATTRRWQFYRDSHVLCCYRVRPSGLSFNVVQMQHYSEQVIQAAYHRLPEVISPVLPTAYAYMYRYLARLSLASRDFEGAQDFIQRAITADSSIFYRDWRSLITLLAVWLRPIAQTVIGRLLGSVTRTQK